MSITDRPAVKASQPATPPMWAQLQRRLFDVLDGAWRAFEERYTEGDGRVVYRDRLGLPPDDRDGVDDFYEPFFNWPALYLLGGSDELLAAAKRHWEGVTAQLSELGMLTDEYERGYDWFHQGEGLLLFYLICLADPADTAFAERAERFARLYLPEGPGNYDPEHNILRAPHLGADGPRPGLGGADPYFPWSPVFVLYGLPLEDVEGITEYQQLLDDDKLARRMGEAMFERMGRGDTAVNLAVTSLMANAFMLSGDKRYRDWALHYVDGWLERTRGNDGLLPDNVGLGGKVGEYLGGRWYGAHYGWSWPHGVHSVGFAAAVAAINAALLAGDDTYLDLGRSPLDTVLAQGRQMAPADSDMTMGSRWQAQFATRQHQETLLVPYRIADSGWHDYHPMQTALPLALWHYSGNEADLARIRSLEAGSSYPWSIVYGFRDKEEAGHEEPWFTYLDGRFPTYPEQALSTALRVVDARLNDMASDPTDPAVGPDNRGIHLWQNLNPVVTETLTQLCLGAPQMLYNGGLLQARIRYYDTGRRRPGLPDDVAALVSRIDMQSTIVTLVNTGDGPRSVTVQAGAFAEHDISAYRAYEPGVDPGDWQSCPQPTPWLDVELDPTCSIALELRLTRRANEPSYRRPWDRSPFPSRDDPLKQTQEHGRHVTRK